MAKTYADIQQEIAALQKSAEAMRLKEVAGVIERIKLAIATYQLSPSDLGLTGKLAVAAPAVKKTRKTKPKAGAKGKTASVAMYRDVSGKTWSGHGRRPGWFLAALAAGKQVEDLRA